jgi:hypothetical protein
MRAAVLKQADADRGSGLGCSQSDGKDRATISPIEPERRGAHALTMHAEDCHRVNSACQREWMTSSFRASHRVRGITGVGATPRAHAFNC